MWHYFCYPCILRLRIESKTKEAISSGRMFSVWFPRLAIFYTSYADIVISPICRFWSEFPTPKTACRPPLWAIHWIHKLIVFTSWNCGSTCFCGANFISAFDELQCIRASLAVTENTGTENAFFSSRFTGRKRLRQSRNWKPSGQTEYPLGSWFLLCAQPFSTRKTHIPPHFNRYVSFDFKNIKAI